MMTKIIFNNMEDDAYKITKKTMSVNDSKTYVNHLNEIKRKSIKVEDKIVS